MSEPTPRSSRDPEDVQAMVARVVDEVLHPETRHERAALVRLVMSSLRHRNPDDLEEDIRDICRRVVPSILGPQYTWPDIRKHVETAATAILGSRHHHHYEELVEVTLEKLLKQGPGEEKTVRKLKKFIKTVCVGEWNRLYKKSQRLKSSPLEELNGEITSDRADDAFIDVDEDDVVDRIFERFGRRSAKHRHWAELLRSHYVDGRTQAEIAEQLDISASAVSQQMKKARAALERFMDRDGM
ncbi:MAG TPA: sigma-70 family RNA polymerase sigma factor [Acidimicrobiales bacterium]|nr:sigma-70 family RNA polymerase sigma factor [Acidimicrobiales bacterium]